MTKPLTPTTNTTKAEESQLVLLAEELLSSIKRLVYDKDVTELVGATDIAGVLYKTLSKATAVAVGSVSTTVGNA